MIKKKIKKVCIVGFGSIGKKHFEIINEVFPDIKIILVSSKKNLDKIKQINICLITNNLNEAIRNCPDAAFICTPAPFHVSQATKFVQNKIPVFIEKPISNTLDGIDNLKKFVNKYKVPVLVGYVLRYSDSLNFFRKKIIEKKIKHPNVAKIICKSYLPDWRPGQDYKVSASAKKKLGGGVLLELSHELDYAKWLFGELKVLESKIINTRTLKINVEDCANLKLISKKGTVVHIGLNFISKKKIRKCIFTNKSKSLIWDGIANKVIYKSNKRTLEKKKFISNTNDIYKKQIIHFFKCVTKAAKPVVSLEESIDVLNLIIASKKLNKQKNLSTDRKIKIL